MEVVFYIAKDRDFWCECFKSPNHHMTPNDCKRFYQARIKELEEAITEALEEDCGGHAQVILREALGGE